MRFILSFFSCFLFYSIIVFGGGPKYLKFNEEGHFKIVQFTDTHFHFDSPKSNVVMKTIEKVLTSENPDFVIFTGDIITKAPLMKGWKIITDPVIKREIPWAVTLGNHDHEHDVKRENIIPLIKDIPYNLTSKGNEQVHGYGNYVLPVKKNSADKTAALIYCMDSNAYTPIEDIGKYGWFKFSQIQWYRETSSRFIKKNAGHPLPSLAFFHIPLPEYTEAWEKGDMTPVGIKNEEVYSPAINTGMFASMLQQKDVMGVFVGHDHVNDYVSSLYGIALAYGRFSGGGDTYGDLTSGARVIVMEENKKHFTTWIRLKNGKKINEYTHSYE